MPGPDWYNPGPASWAPTAWGGPQAYGTKPVVPQPTRTAATALAGNIGNLGLSYGLGKSINTFQTGQASQQLAQNLPGYQNLITKSSGNIQSMLSGQVPEDVVNSIIQGAAERGIMTGSPGSPNANAALLRALGLTSLGLQQTGETELTGAIGRTPTPALYQPTSGLVSPEQQQAASMAQALYTAAPDPSAAAAASLRTASSGLGAGLGTPQTPLISTTGAGGYGYGGPMQTVYPSQATALTYGGVPMEQPPMIGGPTNWGNAYGNVSLPIRDEPPAGMITQPTAPAATWDFGDQSLQAGDPGWAQPAPTWDFGGP
jgi:hypothetical protein